ncbi:uncharacterized protein LOC114756710 [Neltuma alba]|uniref:uncharacterized protein LOC114756710 n=1 Tax=Neltuma alba TaxID=207710 RepID=UPI0010A52CE3|nr:uncharacterized protein LOC114756710 [Prosopis alba]
MESRQKTPSVMAQLMGLDKEPSQLHVKEKQRVLSEKYLQKVASIGFRRKRLPHQNNSSRMSSDENEECGEVLRAFKSIKRDESHELSSENRKESLHLFEPRIIGLEQQLFKGETLIYPVGAFDIEKSVKHAGRTSENGNLQMLDEIDSDLQRNVNRETRLYEMLKFSRSQLESKGRIFPSRIVVLKPSDGKGESSLKCFSLPSSGYYPLVNGMLKKFSSHESSKSFPGIKKRKKLSDHVESIDQSPTAFSKISDEVSSQTGDASSRVIDMSSDSFFRKNETCLRSSEILKPVSYDDPRTETKDIVHKYWGLSKDACLNSSLQESKKQNTNVKDFSIHTTHWSYPEKSKSLLSYSFNSNCKEESLVRLHKLKKKFFGVNLSEQKPKLPEMSPSQPSFSYSDSQIIHQASIIKDEASRLIHDNISKENVASHNSSVYGQVADERTDAVGRPLGNPRIQVSETRACILLEDSDSSSHTSYASIQREESEFLQEDDSVYLVCSDVKTDSVGSFDEAHEPSPISVLEPPFGEDVSFGSDSLKFAGDDLYDSPEMDNEGLGFSVSSDEDCLERSAGDLEEKQDFVGFLRAEESREFSYVVEVLTEAGLSNTNLYTDFCTWHSLQCPISRSIFENLEMKFGKQSYWKRSDRMLLFDRINLSLLEILQPCMCIPAWEKPVSRWLNAEPSYDMMEEQLWELLVAQEKEAKKDSADKMHVEGNSWIELRYDIEDIVRQVVQFLMEELEEETISF